MHMRALPPLHVALRRTGESCLHVCAHTRVLHERVHTCTEAQGRCALAQQGRGVAGGSDNSGPCNLIPQGWAGPGPLRLLSRLPEASRGEAEQDRGLGAFCHCFPGDTKLRAADVLQWQWPAGSHGWLHHVPALIPQLQPV